MNQKEIEDLKIEVEKTISGKNPKNFTKIFKKPSCKNLLENLKNYVNVHLNYQTNNVTEMVYITLNSPPLMCGNNKYPVFNNYYEGYRQFCSITKECICKSNNLSVKGKEKNANKTKEEKQESIRNAQIASLEKRKREEAIRQAIALWAPPPKCRKVACNNACFLKGNYRFSKHCSRKCKGSDNSLVSREKASATMMERYNVAHALRCPIFLNKAQNTLFKNYGVRTPMESAILKARQQEILMKNHGTISPWTSAEKRQMMVDEVAAYYGYERGTYDNVSKIPEIHSKKSQSLYTHKEYLLPSGKIIKVQGYEDRFLDQVLVNHHEDEITKPSSIMYLDIDGNNRAYHPDFEYNNHVVEIKSDYTFFKDYDDNLFKCYGILKSGKNIVIKSTNGKKLDSYVFYNSNTMLVKSDFSDQNIEYYECVDKLGYIVNFFVPGENLAVVVKDVDFMKSVNAANYYKEMKSVFKKNKIKLVFVGK